MTQVEACAYLQTHFPNNLVQFADIRPDNWCGDCVAIHESTHLWQDWVEEQFMPAVEAFMAYLDLCGVPINCSQPTSLHCQTAITASVKSELDNAWEYFMSLALIGWQLDPDSEGDAQAAELECYQQIADALRAKCLGN
jgi:hypothetical protein